MLRASVQVQCPVWDHADFASRYPPTVTQVNMTFRKMPARLSDQPSFTYTRATKRPMVTRPGRKGKRIVKPMGIKAFHTLYKARSTYQGRLTYARRISEDVIDPTRWSDKNKKTPRGCPAGLSFPEDVMKAVLHSKILKPLKSKHPKVNRVAKAHRLCQTCDTAADHVDELCNCTTVPWAERLTESWREQNIELRLVSDEMGIGAFALQPLPQGLVLGEYLGELVHNGDIDSTYLFNITNDKTGSRPLACIDALRVGNWTRFINPSCEPNSDYEIVRVGEEVKFVIGTRKAIEQGEEIMVSYGDEGYWEMQNRKGLWCGCGMEGCKWSEEAVQARADEEELE